MADNFKSDLEMDRQELMEQGFDPDYNDRDDSLTGEPTSRTDLAKSLGKTGFAGLALIARQLGFDFYPTKDTERAIEKRLGFAEGGDTYGMAAQMDDLVFRSPDVEIDPDELRQASIDTEREVMRGITDPDFEGFKYKDLDLAAPPMSTTKKSPYSRRPGFRGDGPLDFKGFGSYLKENVSEEELTAGLDNAGEWMVPFYEAGSNMANVISEYNKPEDERDYDYIKEELGKAGNSAATEAAMWLMGGIAVKYGGKGIKAIADKVKQYEIDPNTTSAFGVGAIKKKAPVIKEGVPTIEAAGLTDEVIDAWRKANETSPEFRKSLKGRNEELMDLAAGVKEGRVFNTTYRKRADELRPIRKVTDVPKPATIKDTVSALDANKRSSPIVGLNYDIPDGDVITARLDIPAYTNYDTWVPTLRHSGKTMYKPALRMKNVRFIQPEGGEVRSALDVAVGPERLEKTFGLPEKKAKAKGNKSPFAVMQGEYVKATDGEAYEYATSIFDNKEWTQVGYDPTKRGFFYDRETGEAILEATEVIQVGHLVLAKNAKKADPEIFGFNEGGMAMKEQMGYALGGDVEIDAESGNEVPPGSRPEEVRDDIPAMLSEGEYVVPADVTRYYGVKFFEDLREQAKTDLAEMDANGRIGGEPVPETEDDLTEDEMSLLGEVMAMNQGGMVPQMNQPQMMNPIPSVDPQMQQMQQQPQPTTYNQPVGMNQGGMIGQRPNTDAFGNPIGPGTNQTPPTMPTYLQDVNTTGSNVYGVNRGGGGLPTSSIQVQGPISTRPTPPTGQSGMKSVYYIHKDGRRIYVLMLNGRPISPTPADFSEFLEDTPENRAKLNFTEGGSGGGTGGGTGDTGPATTGATEDTGGGDDNSTDVYKTSATGEGVTRDTNTPEGAYEAYKDSGVDVRGTVEAAKKALDDTTKIPKAVGMVAGAVNPFLGLAVGAGNVANQLEGISKAHANKRMAEFLGKTEDANAIQADIDRFLQNAPGAVGALDSIVASGEKRFQEALNASTSIYAPDGAVIAYEDLNEIGKQNINEYLMSESAGYAGATIGADGIIRRASGAPGSSIRPPTTAELDARASGVAAEPKVAARPKGKYDPTSNPQLSGGFTTNTLSAAEQNSFDAAVDSGNGAVANHFASINRLRNKQDAYAESGFDPAVGASMGLSTHDMEQAEKYGGSVQTAINEGRAEKESGVLNFLKPVKVTDTSKSKTGTTTTSTRKTSTERVASTGGSTTSTIKRGDTLTKIARENNTTVDALVAANPQIKNKNVIKAGDKISIPKTTSRNKDDKPSTTSKSTSSKSTTSRSTSDIQKEINQKIKNATDSSGNVDWNKADVGKLVKEREASKNKPAAKPASKPKKSSGGSSKSASKPKKSGKCFLTTAIVDRRGEADNGPTLTKLRNFRDTYMAAIPADVEEYYRVAPQIVASIPADHKDWDWIGSQVDKSVEFIDNNLLDDAYKTYKAMVKKLERDWL